MSREEEALLWRSLERIPEIYREPLVLFYREHQSIEHVAAALDLTEDAVKQRLARGRKLLTAEVTSFVEEALQRTTPGKAFTVAVLAALPLTMSTSAKAASLGAVAAKGTMMAKAAAGAGFFSAVLTPVMGFVGPWLQYRLFLKTARTEKEPQCDQAVLSQADNPDGRLCRAADCADSRGKKVAACASPVMDLPFDRFGCGLRCWGSSGGNLG